MQNILSKKTVNSLVNTLFLKSKKANKFNAFLE